MRGLEREKILSFHTSSATVFNVKVFLNIRSFPINMAFALADFEAMVCVFDENHMSFLVWNM